MGQKRAMDENIGPFTYNAGRFVVSTCFLFLVRPSMQNLIDSNISLHKDFRTTLVNKTVEKIRLNFPILMSTENFHLCLWSLLNGVGIFLANELLQVGLVSTSAGKAAFIVGLYVVFIPAMEQLWNISNEFYWQTWASAGMCVIGLFFMSGCVDAMMAENGESCSDAVGRGDILVFASMLAFSCALMVTDTAAKRVDCIDLTCGSFVVTTVLCIAMALCFEPSEWISWPPLHALQQGWDMVLLVGVSEASAMGLGTLGQMYTPAARAALLTSLEASVSAFFAYIFLGEVLSYAELFGCVLMLSATLVSTSALEDEDQEDDSDAEDDIPDDGSVASIKRRRARSVRKRRRHFKNVYKRRTKSAGSLRGIPRRTYSYSEIESAHHEAETEALLEPTLQRSVSDPVLCSSGNDELTLEGHEGSVVEMVRSYVHDGIDVVNMLLHSDTSKAGSPVSMASEKRNVPDASSDLSSSISSSAHSDQWLDDSRDLTQDTSGDGEYQSSTTDSERHRTAMQYSSSLNHEYSHLLAIPPYSPRRNGSGTIDTTTYGSLQR